MDHPNCRCRLCTEEMEQECPPLPGGTPQSTGVTFYGRLCEYDVPVVELHVWHRELLRRKHAEQWDATTQALDQTVRAFRRQAAAAYDMADALKIASVKVRGWRNHT